jgi:hypothetical protein
LVIERSADTMTVPRHSERTSLRRELRKRVAVLAAVLAAATGIACANASLPPGGPPDTAPPTVLRITPSSGSTDIRPREVELQFDEVVSESPSGAQDLGSIVFISPKSGVPRVSWERDRITIRPREGFLPNKVYSVEIRPGLMDLRSNVLDSAIRVVFSTGGPIPDTKVSGVIFDWVSGRPAALALVEAIAPDSTIYQTLADSVGRFSLQHLPAARYVLRGVIDRNSNRELERLELWDSTGVVVTADVQAELYAFQHDTLPMRFQTIAYNDSLNELRVTFDKPFEPGFQLEAQMFRLVASDSTPILITRVMSLPEKRLADSVRAKQREDSIARSRVDTTAAGRARADSVARQRVADSLAAESRAAERRRIELLRRGNQPVAAVDSTPPPKMNRPLPFAEVILTPDRKLQPGATYRLSATRLRSISGTTSPTPGRNFVVPRPPPPRPARDSTQGRPP